MPLHRSLRRLLLSVLSLAMVACHDAADVPPAKPATRVVIVSDTLRIVAGDTTPQPLLVQAFAADGGPAAGAALRADVERPGVIPKFARTDANGVASFPVTAGTVSGSIPILVRFADPDLSSAVLARTALIVRPAALLRFTPDATVDSVAFVGEVRPIVVSGVDQYGNRVTSTLVVTAVPRDTAIATAAVNANIVTVTMRSSGATWVVLTVGAVRDSVRVVVVPLGGAVALLPPDGTSAIEGVGIIAGLPWITADSASHRRPYRRLGNTWMSVPLPDGRWRIESANDGLLFGRVEERANEVWLSEDGGLSWRIDLLLADPIRTLHLAKGRPPIVVAPRPAQDVGSAGWYALRRLNGVWTPLAWPADASETSWTLPPELAYAGSRLLLFTAIRGPTVGYYFGLFRTVSSIRTYALRDSGWAYVDSLTQTAPVTTSIIVSADTVAARVRIQVVAGWLVLFFPPSPSLQTYTWSTWVGESGLRVDPWVLVSNNSRAVAATPDARGRIISALQDVVWTLGSDNRQQTPGIPAPWWAIETPRPFVRLDGDWCWILVTPHYIDSDERPRLLRMQCLVP